MLFGWSWPQRSNRLFSDLGMFVLCRCCWRIRLCTHLGMFHDELRCWISPLFCHSDMFFGSFHHFLRPDPQQSYWQDLWCYDISQAFSFHNLRFLLPAPTDHCSHWHRQTRSLEIALVLPDRDGCSQASSHLESVHHCCSGSSCSSHFEFGSQHSQNLQEYSLYVMAASVLIS